MTSGPLHALDLSGTSILVLAPHPDDEVIGCGATIARAKEVGARVYVHFVTVGDVDEWSPDGHSTLEQRTFELKRVAERLDIDGFAVSFPGDQYHLRLDTVPQRELIDAIDMTSQVAVQDLRPDVVMMPSLDSYNQDHRAVARAALAAMRPSDTQLRHQPSVVVTYEELSDHWSGATTPEVNLFVEMTERHLRQKLDALEMYESQLRAHPNPRSLRSLEALAVLRGAQCGAGYAEAFRCLRWRI